MASLHGKGAMGVHIYNQLGQRSRRPGRLKDLLQPGDGDVGKSGSAPTSAPRTTAAEMFLETRP